MAKGIKKSKDIDKELEDSLNESVGQFINKEIYLELRNNHLQLELLKSEMNKLVLDMQLLEREKLLKNLKKDEFRNKISDVEAQHQAFLEKVKKEHKIDLRNKSINPETYEVL